MRLREIQQILSSSLDKLNIAYVETHNNLIKIEGYMQAIETLEDLYKYDFLKANIDELRKIVEIYNARTEVITVNDAVFSTFTDILDDLIGKVEASIELIKQILQEEELNSISIKLPEYSSLKKIGDFAKSLDKALNQLICVDSINGRVELKNFDSGSIWFEIAVGTSYAVSVIGGAAWAGAVIRKKLLEGDILKAKVKALKIQNNALEEIEKGLEKEISILCEKEAKNLISNHNIENSDPEYIDRVKYSIREFANLIKEGAEIHHSLMAPEDVKNLFPEYKKINSIESKILHIEDKSS